MNELNSHDSLLYFSSYKTYDPAEDLYYGDLHPCDRPTLAEDEVRFVLPGYLFGSDYSGGSVEVSNHRLFLEEFGELEGVHNVYAGYGTYGVAIRLDVWRAGADRTVCAWFGADEEIARCDQDGPCAHQMRAWLDKLEDYPVADEDDLCQVEIEAQDEAWDSWAESDFARAIRDAFPDDVEDVDVSDSGRFRTWFEEVRESANVYWENETGNSAQVDVERVADELEDINAVIDAAEQVEDGSPAHGFKLELIRRVSYLPYCQTCALLISDEGARSRDEALRREGTHEAHTLIALQQIVYADPGVEP